MMDRHAVHAMLQGILDRLQARKELAIAKVAPKLVGVEDVAEAEEILAEYSRSGRWPMLPRRLTDAPVDARPTTRPTPPTIRRIAPST